MRTLEILAVVLALSPLAILATCDAAAPPPKVDPEQLIPWVSYTVHETEIVRFHDDTVGATCWLAQDTGTIPVSGGRPKAISCIADSALVRGR